MENVITMTLVAGLLARRIKPYIKLVRRSVPVKNWAIFYWDLVWIWIFPILLQPSVAIKTKGPFSSETVLGGGINPPIDRFEQYTFR